MKKLLVFLIMLTLTFNINARTKNYDYNQVEVKKINCSIVYTTSHEKIEKIITVNYDSVNNYNIINIDDEFMRNKFDIIILNNYELDSLINILNKVYKWDSITVNNDLNIENKLIGTINCDIYTNKILGKYNISNIYNNKLSIYYNRRYYKKRNIIKDYPGEISIKFELLNKDIVNTDIITMSRKSTTYKYSTSKNDDNNMITYHKTATIYGKIYKWNPIFILIKSLEECKEKNLIVKTINNNLLK